MLAFTILLREWWKSLDKTEQRIMMETVFCPPRKERRGAGRSNHVRIWWRRFDLTKRKAK